MILPGFPRIAGKRGKSPFLLSGTFATNMDGWTGTGAWGPTEFYTRTIPGYVQLSSGGIYIEYFVPKALAAGMKITASLWQRTQSGSTISRSFQRKIGTGSFVAISNVNDGSMSYQQLTGTFDNPGNDDVIIRYIVNDGGFTVLVDDWAIAGEPL